VSHQKAKGYSSLQDTPVYLELSSLRSQLGRLGEVAHGEIGEPRILQLDSH
jgi:hypothetical protein